MIVVLLGGFAPYRIAGPHAAASHSVAASDLRTGNCFNMTSGSSAVTSVQVQEISCDQPHNFQVYAEPAITDSSFSGAAIAHSDADETCNDFDSISAVSDIVPVGYTIIDFYPGSASAFASQKDFICVLQVPNQTDESWLTSDNTN